jgi:O-Antigen ligase
MTGGHPDHRVYPFAGPVVPGHEQGAGDEPGPGGDWPHTTRVMPWLIAIFLGVIFLVPVDSISAPIPLPIDSELDRLALGAVAGIWIVTAVAGGAFRPQPRRSLLGSAVLLLLAVTTTSVIVNTENLAALGELELAIKKLGLLFAFAVFFVVAVTSIRVAEVRAFSRLAVALGCILAAGTILEYRTGANLFFDAADMVLPGAFRLTPPPTDPLYGRAAVTGPTLHGLEVATLLSLTLPLAIMGMLQAGATKGRLLNGFATALIFAGAAATDRKSAIIVPLVVILVLVLYRPRAMFRLAPLGVALLLLIPVLSPGALGSIRGQLMPSRVSNDASTTGRTSDYQAVTPDIQKRLVLGRGFGSYDPHAYRLLDNQYLGLAVESGLLGIGAFVLVLIATVAVAHRAIRSADPVRGPPALAAAAAAAGLAVAAALFDLLAYPQVPYLFFFLGALAVVCARGLPEPRATRAPVPLTA